MSKFPHAFVLLTFCALVGAIVGQQNEKPLVFRNVDVFDGSRLIRHTMVLVRDGMVRAVGQGIEIPSGAEIVDGNGKTLLPGLIDTLAVNSINDPSIA
jgi:N-acyl-D-aspartate/D-glutamate deacylase